MQSGTSVLGAITTVAGLGASLALIWICIRAIWRIGRRP